jgi:hypothetical protein
MKQKREIKFTFFYVILVVPEKVLSKNCFSKPRSMVFTETKNIGWEYIEVLCALQGTQYLQENEQKRQKPCKYFSIF